METEIWREGQKLREKEMGWGREGGREVGRTETELSEALRQIRYTAAI